MAQITRVLPDTSPFGKEFYEGLKRHELLIQKCKNCGKVRFWPIEMCPYCNSFNYDWYRCSGKGTVHSYTIIPQHVHPAYASPWVTLLVELEEGSRVITHGLMAPEDVHIGMLVEVEYEKINDEVTLHAFRKAK